MTTGEGLNPTGEHQEQGKQELSAADLMKEVEALKATNARLLEESKGFKEKSKRAEQEALEASKRVEEEKRRIAAEANDHVALLKMEKEEKAKIAAKAMSLEERLLKQEIRSAVAKHCPDAIDLEDVLNQPSFQSVLKDAVDRENFVVIEDPIKQYAETLKKEKAHLFKQSSQAGVVTKKPGPQSGLNSTTKSFKDLSNKELMDLALAGKL